MGTYDDTDPSRRLPWRALACLVIVPAALIAASTCVLVLALVRAPAAWIDRLYSGFGRFCLAVAGTQVEIRGLEHIESGCAYVVVANHESSWDPIVLLAALRHIPVRFIVKQQLAHAPVLGPALMHSGNVCVERTNTAGDTERIRHEMTRRRHDVSILFYAEGTRARDGAFHPFKKGAFVTAMTEGLPILPVATAGTYRVLPPATLGIRPGIVTVEVGAPVSTVDIPLDARDDLRDQVHAGVGRLRALARQRLRAHGVEPGGVD